MMAKAGCVLSKAEALGPGRTKFPWGERGAEEVDPREMDKQQNPPSPGKGLMEDWQMWGYPSVLTAFFKHYVLPSSEPQKVLETVTT